MSVPIVCTIGPASDRLSVLRRMARAGMSVARLNFSHGTLAGHARRIRLVRKIPEKRVLVMQDLEGWRIRLGDWKGGKPVPLKKGDRFRLVPGGKRRPGEMPWDYDGPPEKIRAGMKIYVDDAFIELVARGRHGAAINVEVVRPGPLKPRKGVHVPDLDWSPRGIRPADFEHLEFGIAHGVDWVALSFVRDRYDVAEVRLLLDAAGSRAKIVSKIESRQSIENLPGIIQASDLVLVARGDLGICVPLEYVPFLQKRILKECRQHGKPAITATQMLESMIENPRPTRAEVSDVANAVLDGTDYTMLSGETAVGRYPVECVEMMSRILRVAARASRR